MCTKKVRDWLVLLTMEKYVRCFTERGYTTIAQCRQILSSDLVMLGIDDPNHRQLLLKGVQLLINSPELFACHEPCELHYEDDGEDLAEDFMEACQRDLEAMASNFGLTISTTREDDDSTLPAVEGKQYALNIAANFTCVACPHLQFGELYELDQHISEVMRSDDPSASEHKYGTLITNIQDSTPIILLD